MAEINDIDKSDITDALKKLISMVYHDKSNTNLHLRRKLAEYLHKHEKDKIVNRVYSFLKGNLPDEKIIGKIKYQVIPKRVKSESYGSEYLTNSRTADRNIITDINLIIDTSIEVHILSVLWLLKFGARIDSELSKTCYGNRLVLDDDLQNVSRGRALLKPYIRQYKKWRDEGIKVAKNQLEVNNDVAFVNLDISSYYYNVRLEWDDLKIDYLDSEKLERLDNLIRNVHEQYTGIVLQKFKYKCGVEESVSIDDGKVILPLGLVSSYTLANWYLKGFDNAVNQSIRPLYYGRYVDDIVMVISKPIMSKQDKDQSQLWDLINRWEHDIEITSDPIPESVGFILRNLSEVLKVENYFDSEKKSKSFRFRLKTDVNNLLCIQNKKVMIHEFVAGESKSVIEKLIKDIEERSSEFQFLPNDKETNFDTDAYELIYDDSHGKPRTLKDYKESKLGLASYLYRRTAVAIWADKGELADESEKIVAFFSGKNLIDYYQYWERVFTYLVVAKRRKEIFVLLKRAKLEIEKCRLENDSKAKKSLQDTLQLYLLISFAQALSLNPTMCNSSWFEKRIVNLYDLKWFEDLSNLILALRNTRLLRDYFIPHPMLEYTSWASGDEISELPSLVGKIFPWDELNSNDFQIGLIELYPRFIRFYECSIYHLYKSLLKEKEGKSNMSAFTTEYLTNVEDLFIKVNGLESFYDQEPLFAELTVPMDGRGLSDTEKVIQEIHLDQYSESIEQDEEINNASNQGAQNICIGLANMKVDWVKEASYSLRGRPIVNRKRYNRISEILNKFTREKSSEDEEKTTDLAVLPEFSIPHDFLGLMASYTKRRQKGLVFGLEHINTGTHAYNFIITCLPVSLNQRTDAVLIPRIKNHYSHEELNQIGANHLLPGKNPQDYYHLFKWRNLYFTSFYCFELADIEHRSWFRSKIDLLIASEFNQDTNYFSNIVESTSRDLNVFVAQANSSDYGDNRITRPAKTVLINLSRVDGGDNDLVIISTIDLKGFREFQELAYPGQKGHSVYKPSPPNFDVSYVKKRIKGEWIFDDEE